MSEFEGFGISMKEFTVAMDAWMASVRASLTAALGMFAPREEPDENGLVPRPTLLRGDTSVES